MAEKKAILLRLSPERSDALQRWARDELRSVNAQIEYILREAVRRRAGGRTGPGGVPTADPAEDLAGVVPWLNGLVAELRKAGLTDWAQRVEGVLSYGATPGEMLGNLRATLGELAAAPVVLPDPAARLAGGLWRAGDEVTRAGQEKLSP